MKFPSTLDFENSELNFYGSIVLRISLLSPITQTSFNPHPIFSFADGEMGGSNTIIRFVEQITGQPRVEKLYFDYVGDNLNPQSFWSDALDRLRIELDVRRDVLDGVVSSIPATGRVVAIANHPYGVIDGLS